MDYDMMRLYLQCNDSNAVEQQTERRSTAAERELAMLKWYEELIHEIELQAGNLA